MGLSSELVSQFAKVTNDSSRNTNGTKLYGTIAMLGEVPHVKLDGTEELTPISRTVEVAEGDRVEVMIVNHSATVTGNLTDPSIGIVRAGSLESKIEQTAEAIRLEVSDIEGTLSGNISTVENGIREDLSNGLASMSDSLTKTADDIRKELGDEITQLETNTNKTFTNLNTTIESLTLNVSNLDSKITQTASEIRSEVSASVSDLNATIVNNDTAVRDTINLKVADLETSISQTATSIRSEVSASLTTVDGKITDLSTRVTQNATSITSLVSKDEEFSSFMQTVNGFTFMNNGGTVKIGSGSLDLTGAITFTDLSKAVADEINAISDTADSALNTANTANTTAVSAQEIAESAERLASTASTTASNAEDLASDASSTASSARSLAKSIANGTYVNGTFIDGKSIKSPTIEGNEIKVYGTFQTMYYDGVSTISTGYMGAAQGKALVNGSEVDSYGVALARTWNSDSYTVSNSYVIVTEYGVRLQYGTNSLTVSGDGIWLTARSGKAYYNGTEIGSGSGTTVTAVWG